MEFYLKNTFLSFLNNFDFDVFRYLVKKLAKIFNKIKKKFKKSNPIIYDIAKIKRVFFLNKLLLVK